MPSVFQMTHFLNKLGPLTGVESKITDVSSKEGESSGGSELTQNPKSGGSSELTKYLNPIVSSKLSQQRLKKSGKSTKGSSHHESRYPFLVKHFLIFTSQIVVTVNQQN